MAARLLGPATLHERDLCAAALSPSGRHPAPVAAATPQARRPAARDVQEYPKDHRSDSSRSRSDASHGRAARSRSCGGSGIDSGIENGAGAGGNFEFCKEERAAVPATTVAVSAPFFRQQVPSKWNDAEKWIAGRHVVHSNPIFSKKPAAAAAPPCPGDRVAPESATASRASGAAASALTELSSKSSSPSSCVRVGVDAGRRDGDDADREPGAVAQRHPCRRRHAVAQPALLGAVQPQGRRRLRVGVVVGLRVGTGAPAQDAARDRRARPVARQDEHRVVGQQGGEPPRRRVPGEGRRYQRKEVKIQEWESLQKSKFEAKLRQAEAQAEQMKARAKQDLARRLSALSHRVEGKQARVEARRSRQASRLARQVERIRKTGQISEIDPSSVKMIPEFLMAQGAKRELRNP
ncbi:unnamed protein product [Miscanthus lutarioriparius]|uniref:Remorin C-terminal domain-containing protein n=1 Tax=Miscanthus lutarioriparius TaxID=422564 RepID=A0A811NS68_9POAL|nr:unnamed protein product [Miscanthus lutarioriparius]